MEREPSIRQKPQDPNGQVPSAVDISSSIGYAETKAAPLRVNIQNSPTGTQLTVARRFMSDKIMPLSQAVEGYDLFDKMKVQKVVFEAQK